jgi:O-antigen ligase
MGERIQRAILISFLALFFLTPLFWTPRNFELFEFNKMVLVYLLVVVIAGLWVARMIVEKRFIFRRTFLFCPLVLFLLSQILSTVFSIDRHTSIFGYYSRFHGGLLSTISYLVLFWALVSNGKRGWVWKIFTASLAATAIVVAYGIAEHFGVDRNLWIQDVQRRVFSTFGQPNWLAAYLDIMLMLLLASYLIDPWPGYSFLSMLQKNLASAAPPFRAPLKVTPKRVHLPRLRFLKGTFGFLFFFLLYLCLLYTKSRSGFLGFGFGLTVFGGLFALIAWRQKSLIRKSAKPFLSVLGGVLLISVLVGTPFSPKLADLLQNRKVELKERGLAQQGNNVNITPSSQIREIVWRGAIALWKKYPIFGTGVETFAYSYYWVRPVEHNLTSEWDFLYNKAHNEYLNFAATTGSLGLISYLLIPLVFLGWAAKKLKIKSASQRTKLKIERIYLIGLVCGLLTILLTNFFGFSVVGVALWFFLIPGLGFLLFEPPEPEPTNEVLGGFQVAALLSLAMAVLFGIYLVAGYWLADFYFAKADGLRKAGNYPASYRYFRKAISFNPGEPTFWSRYSQLLAELAVLSRTANNKEQTEKFIDEAISLSDKVISTSPYHLNFYKERARMFYVLSQIDTNYLKNSLDTILKAISLAPTDPKLYYNAGLMFEALGRRDRGIEYLRRSLELKPNYDKAEFWLKQFQKSQ